MNPVSLIVPTYNEASAVGPFLGYHREHFNVDEIIVVDGGSTDGTVSRLRDHDQSIEVLETEGRGRGHQLGRGLDQATGEWVLMLHVDTRLPQNFVLERFEPDCGWGWFDCRLDASGPVFRMISRAISLRSALFSTPTGDQALWARRELLETVGGIPDVPIMEDVLLVKALRDNCAGQRVKQAVTTSARKWEQEGAFKVILLMWFFRLAHVFGASPEWIYRSYYGEAPETG